MGVDRFNLEILSWLSGLVVVVVRGRPVQTENIELVPGSYPGSGRRAKTSGYGQIRMDEKLCEMFN